jgi:hypothetical protein
MSIEELDESMFWLEMLVSTESVPEHRLSDLIGEGYQSLKILNCKRKISEG